MSPAPVLDARDISAWRDEVGRRVSVGDRFAGLFATVDGGAVRLTAAIAALAPLAASGTLGLLDATVPLDAGSYPALTPLVPAAFWYERAVHDLVGIVPEGHPRLDPLILPLSADSPRPRPGAPGQPDRLTPHEQPLPAHLSGTGLFTLPHGPVRSGVVESVEFLIETPGEDIPHLRVRPHAKHRGLDKRFEQLPVHRGVLLAERVEGIASVAHALAYAHAVEDLAGAEVPPAAGLVRVVHAELERIANHLDVAMRLADAAALAVATARFGWHKERVLRLRSQLCGSRYGRGVVIAGGVSAGLRLPVAEARAALQALDADISRDERAAMVTPSFLDRLRGTGRLPAEIAARHGALGPIGRASGTGEDVRATRPYDAYAELVVRPATGHTAGDVQDRLRVRWTEIHEAARLILGALDRLAEYGEQPDADELSRHVDVPDGRAVGWSEAPQGEVLYVVEVAGGALRRVAPRSASFHNLPLFHTVFAGDIFTDFAFIEASFGVSIAGVAL
ncbi:MAG: hydrogenase large subunit [Mycobacteriales bacterium]